MCLAIFKPEGEKVTRELMLNANNHEGDGIGIVASTPNGVIRWRGFDFEEFYKIYQQNEEYDCMIHFRGASVGGVNIDNTHPFHIKDNLFMCHNGTFMNYIGNSEKSDTRLVAEDLADIPNIEKCLRIGKEGREAFKKAESIISNQLVILMDDKDFFIFNEQQGSWVDNVWYSHPYYFPNPLQTKLDIEEETAFSDIGCRVKSPLGF
jgi:predicted glutamine amidotransferase